MFDLNMELWILAAIGVGYGGFLLIRFLMYLVSPTPDLYWVVGFWFDKNMKIIKKFGILGMQISALYLITVVYRIVRAIIE